MVLPLLEQKNSLGIVGIYFKDEVVSLNFEQKKLTESVIEYIAQAALRTQLVNELEQAKLPVKQSAYVQLYYLRYRMIYVHHLLLLLEPQIRLPILKLICQNKTSKIYLKQFI